MHERDKTILDYSAESQVPKLLLSCKISETEFYTYGFDIDGKIYQKHTTATNQNTAPYKVSEKIIANFLSAIQMFKNSYGGFYNNEIDNLMTQLNSLKEPIDSKKCDQILNALFKNLDYSIQRSYGANYKRRLIEIAPSNSIMSYYASLTQDSNVKAEALKQEYLGRFKVNLIPTIYRYKERNIETRDLSNNNNSEFLNIILRAINVSSEEINNAYNRFNSTRSRGILSTEEAKLNKKLLKVAAHFNQIYFRSTQTDGDKYSFKFNLDSNGIYISLFRGDNDINLDYQSTGFKWFFNLYFNLICNTKLKPGDIIIMDEPATNLHIGGQIELRKFLKEFAIANDITIIIATHTPFLIDLDYLDELRVITMKDGISHIHNDFTTINDDDPDTLKPVKFSLTVNNHMLLDPDKRVIFVEGITDYNYLVAFKHLNKNDNFIFLPINGVGNSENNLEKRHKEIVKALQCIRKHCPVLMVDGDAAGKSMKEFCTKNKTELKVFSLDEIDPAFKTIESLFTNIDLDKHKIKSPNGMIDKRSSTSSILKTFSKEEDFSKTTVSNFNKLFKYLESL